MPWFMTCSKKKMGSSKDHFATSGYCYLEVANIFMNLFHENKNIFKNILGYYSRGQVIFIHGKTHTSKISCCCPCRSHPYQGKTCQFGSYINIGPAGCVPHLWTSGIQCRIWLNLVSHNKKLEKKNASCMYIYHNTYKFVLFKETHNYLFQITVFLNWK